MLHKGHYRMLSIQGLVYSLIGFVMGVVVVYMFGSSHLMTNELVYPRPLFLNTTDPSAYTIAIVRPFIPGQLDQLLESLLDWDNPDFFPCNHRLSNAPPVTLILYYAYSLNSTRGMEIQKLLTQAYEYSKWRKCFAGLEFMSAHINETADVYNSQDKSGPQVMFFHLFEQPSLYTRFHYTMIMEPDARPIRRRWVDQLERECLWGMSIYSFWMKGSMYVGRKHVTDSTKTPWLLHINGNAIYNSGCPCFRDFVAEVKKLQGTGNAYDVSMWHVAHSKFTRLQDIMHKFIYTPFIRNYGVSNVSISGVRAEWEDTYIVHKKVNCPDCDPLTP
eukprot:TRINITY_DN7201_c0_g1_i1.p1 TRINITY_DN7201_c0_g1~~TRINITY_DN7201_c0_g1_i1.p1  ORF type:complete len:331 (-),score=35.72 TRINITY_DN7201_c0_g1_i1:40-1032(-)